jgi:chemotaxis protein MotB
MASRARIANDPAPPPIIIKKIMAAPHAAHHGGAWKIAYADFVTAMMAFFLLMWLLGMTDEEKRKGLADYFTPTLIEYRQSSAGSDGILGGDSIVAAENYPHKAAQTGSGSIVIPRDVTGGLQEQRPTPEGGQRMAQVREAIQTALNVDPALARQVRLTQTEEGLRIDLLDSADFAMFDSGTDRLEPRARTLIAGVSRAIAAQTGGLVIRGHTDSLPYARGQGMNNWMLSTARAESTRATLLASGIGADRIVRIEGVADRQPFVRSDARDPRNRRIAILLVG